MNLNTSIIDKKGDTQLFTVIYQCRTLRYGINSIGLSVNPSME